MLKQQWNFYLAQSVIRTQMASIESLERQLRVASTNNTALQRQQTQLMESVHTLLNMVASTTGTHTGTHVVFFTQYIYISHNLLAFRCSSASQEPDVEGLCRCLQGRSLCERPVSRLHRQQDWTCAGNVSTANVQCCKERLEWQQVRFFFLYIKMFIKWL